MSIFGTIMSKIFGGHQAGATAAGAGSGAAPTAAAETTAANTGAGAAGSAPPSVSSAPSPDTTGTMGTSTATPAAGGGAGSSPAAGGAQTVDVAEVLDGMERHAGQKLDWRHSIVDLMKLLDMDSSLSARKELAHELNYSGDTSDSASMNIWLHKEVMSKLAANGGKLPADLQH